jgi:hypothetical protein
MVSAASVTGFAPVAKGGHFDDRDSAIFKDDKQNAIIADPKTIRIGLLEGLHVVGQGLGVGSVLLYLTAGRSQ